MINPYGLSPESMDLVAAALADSPPLTGPLLSRVAVLLELVPVDLDSCTAA